jgi:hypothetical protein
MRRFRRPLTAVYLTALFVALGLHDATARWYAPAVAVFVAAGLAITAIVYRRGGTQ